MLGVVEGYYGQPWSAAERLDQIAFLGACGYDAFVYAPKADPSLRRDWRRPFDSAETAALESMAQACSTAGMKFGVGLTPSGATADDPGAAIASLQIKARAIHQAGASVLCVLFDDLAVDARQLAQRQGRLARAAIDAAPFDAALLCPTFYSDDPRLDEIFGAAPAGYAAELGRHAPEKCGIFWTGPKVMAPELTESHLEAVRARFGRRVTLWDNYPVNDSASNSDRLFLKPPPKRNFRRETVEGWFLNPMRQPQLSRPALFAAAHAWRTGERSQDADAGPAIRACFPPRLAAVLLDQRERFERAGRAAFSAEATARLVDALGADAGHPAALELTRWLGGDYAFDPACLTD